jgi:hypothetical protein
MAKKKTVQATAPKNVVLKAVKTKHQEPKFGKGCRVGKTYYVEVEGKKAMMTASQFEKGYEFA